MNEPKFYRNFFLTVFRHFIENGQIYWNHFYGFSLSEYHYWFLSQTIEQNFFEYFHIFLKAILQLRYN